MNRQTSKYQWMQFVLIISMILMSCASPVPVWVPTSLRPTLFETKGDMEVAISYTTPLLADIFTNMTEVHAAAAITDHIAISSTGAWGRGFGPSQRIDSFDAHRKFKTTVLKPWQIDFDLALGYYKASPTSITYEIYGGFGYAEQWTRSKVGDLVNNNVTWSFIDKRHVYNRYYLQQAWGTNGSLLDQGFILKTSLIDYKNASSDLLVEPGYMMRLGFKNLKIMLQYSYLFHTNNTPFEYPSFPLQVGAGFYLLLNDYTFNFRKTKSKNDGERYNRYNRKKRSWLF